MLTHSLTDATFSDLSAMAVPPQCLLLVTGQSFTAKRIDPITGRALECLAHAMTYIEQSKPSQPKPTQESVAADQAIRILKALNRQIFAELPNLPERRSLLRLIVERWEISGLRGEEAAISGQ